MDRFFRGLVAGVTGGIVMNIWSFISYDLLNFTKVRFLDWAAIMIFGDRPRSLIETFMALGTQILFAGFLGVLLAYLLPLVTSRGYIIKGAFFGFVTGFFIYAIPVLFKVQYLKITTMETAASNAIGGVMWGITTALVLRMLDSTPKIKF